jgi:glycosyltransferase involved in cell wall biosynthesis
MHAELIEAWLQSPLASHSDCLLVLVGSSTGDYGTQLNKVIGASGCSGRIKITGWVDDSVFKSYLNAADLAIQLRKESRGESSGSILDCMATGLPTICNAHGSIAELPVEGIWSLRDTFKTEELANALTVLWRDPSQRKKLGISARQVIQQFFAPWQCAELYRDSIEAFYAQPLQTRNTLVKSLAPKLATLLDLTPVAEALEQSLPDIRVERQLLVDVTALAHADLQTGIQRVVRSVLKCLLDSPPKGFRVEPVYTVFGAQGYFYARQYVKSFLEIDMDILADEPVVMLATDVFLGLDLCLSDIFEQRRWFKQVQEQGALVYVVAYDLLPVTHPQWFPKNEQPIFENWLKTIAEFDGVISISETTKHELIDWIKRNPRSRNQPLNLYVAHIGADISESKPSKGLVVGHTQLLSQFKKEITFLMVGTVEPRKGHSQALEAFEHLWASGYKCQLVIVGKPGWNVTQVIDRIEQHVEIDVRLFWFHSISDEFLEMLYAECTCLLAASEAEGFGLPIIEAAQHGLPVLARDISVFREVARSSATYFSATNGFELSLEISTWLKAYMNQTHIQSNSLVYSSWTQCADRYRDIIEQALMSN